MLTFNDLTRLSLYSVMFEQSPSQLRWMQSDSSTILKPSWKIEHLKSGPEVRCVRYSKYQRRGSPFISQCLTWNIVSLVPAIPIIWKAVFTKNALEAGQGMYQWDSLTQMGGILTWVLAGEAVSLPAVPEHTNKWNLTEFVLTKSWEATSVTYSWQLTGKQ